MKQYTQEELEGKFVVAYDTICDGNLCIMEGEDGDADYGPLLFDSEDEAFVEIFDGNYSMLDSHLESDQLEELNEGVTPEMVQEMGEILQSGDVSKMRKFMADYPQCNDSGEWVESATEFIMNRKVIFGANGGLSIEGKKLSE